MTPAVRFLTGADAEAYWHLRVEALGREPRAFARSVDEHRMTSVKDTEGQLASLEAWTVGAFVGEHLRGAATLIRASGWKHRHKAVVAAVYVGPELQGHGLGKRLMTALVAHARTLPDVERIMLTVAADNTAAKALYRRLGFLPWGTERAALKLEGEYIDEDHLVLTL